MRGGEYRDGDRSVEEWEWRRVETGVLREGKGRRGVEAGVLREGMGGGWKQECWGR